MTWGRKFKSRVETEGIRHWVAGMAYRDISAQLKILKTTGGTNSNPANPWYWHAAYFERAAAGESDVSLCIQSRNLL